MQAQLGQVREELLGTMSSLEKERHRAQTLQTLVATSSRWKTELLEHFFPTHMIKEFVICFLFCQGGEGDCDQAVGQ